MGRRKAVRRKEEEEEEEEEFKRLKREWIALNQQKYREKKNLANNIAGPSTICTSRNLLINSPSVVVSNELGSINENTTETNQSISWNVNKIFSKTNNE